MRAARKIFGKICLKAIRDTFFQYVLCDQKRGGGTQFFVWEGGREGDQKNRRGFKVFA